MKNLLFICSENKLRSPTAEAVFSVYPKFDTRSAGLNSDAQHVLRSEDIVWADYIFLMERSHKTRFDKKYKNLTKDKKVIVLDIKDKYSYMDDKLIVELKKKVGRILNL